jgi:hypothetical protein
VKNRTGLGTYGLGNVSRFNDMILIKSIFPALNTRFLLILMATFYNLADKLCLNRNLSTVASHRLKFVQVC